MENDFISEEYMEFLESISALEKQVADDKLAIQVYILALENEVATYKRRNDFLESNIINYLDKIIFTDDDGWQSLNVEFNEMEETIRGMFNGQKKEEAKENARLEKENN